MTTRTHRGPPPRAMDSPSTLDAAPASPGRVADALLIELKALTPGTAGESALRTRVIESYLPMAAYLARRFAGRGESLADLTQVAVIGLIKAVDRFDADRGASFASYAFPTIAGELKRHFRDVVWMVRVPRSLQETRLRVRSGTDELTQLKRSTPTLTEVAAWLGVSGDEVLAARAAGSAYRPRTLQWVAPGGNPEGLAATLGAADPRIEAVDHAESLRVLIAGLPPRERQVVGLRFVDEMSQAQIAARMGVSQMQISRMLAHSLSQLRTGIPTDHGQVATFGPADHGRAPRNRRAPADPGWIHPRPEIDGWCAVPTVDFSPVGGPGPRGPR